MSEPVTVSRRPAPGRALPRVPGWRALGPAAGLLALIAVSAEVRTRALGAPLWGDEGISVGIASHGWGAIPGLLRRDGSPPLYYALLHARMAVFGTSESATHALSLCFALATIPIGLWLGGSLFGARAGWACAGLCALDPLGSTYAQETRMYALVALLSLVVAGAFVHTFVLRRRGFRWLFGGALTALLYTHGWGVFLGLACALAFVAIVIRAKDRRVLLIDGAIAGGVTVVLFAPWVPTLVFQTAHTGAPWASRPHLRGVTRAVHRLAGGTAPLALLAVAAVVATRELWRAGERRELEAAGAVLFLVLATLVIAWGYSQHTAAWAIRYLTILIGPAALVAGLALARSGIAGLAVLVLIAVTWFQLPAYSTLSHKSNARSVASRLAPALRPGDVVVAGQPETGPLLRYELGPRFAYADVIGRVADPQVMDWRDALARLRASGPAAVVAIADRLPRGRRLAFVRPVTRKGGWRAPWTRLVKLRAARLGTALAADPRLRLVATIAPGRRGTESTLRAAVYERR